MNAELNEDLLESWLRISQIVSNRRLSEDLSYNESIVCRILYGAMMSEPEIMVTATDLCARTRMLKSLMNSTLNSLEMKGLTERIRSTEDRRQVYVRLKEDNLWIYRQSHEKILHLVDEIVADVGQEKIAGIIPVLNDIADAVKKITNKA